MPAKTLCESEMEVIIRDNGAGGDLLLDLRVAAGGGYRVPGRRPGS